MQEVVKKVRHARKVVAEVSCPVYETLDELIASEKESAILAEFNHGNHIRIMSAKRATFSGTKTGKKKRHIAAFNSLTVDELMTVAQDADALEALLNSPDIQARVDTMLEEDAMLEEEATVETEEAETIEA